MKALVLEELNKGLNYKEIQPESKAGEVTVQLKAAALNHRDVWITKGLYPGIEFGTILGSDGAGLYNNKKYIINPSFDWGDNPRVQSGRYNILGLPRPGTFAESVSVPEENLVPMPEHLSWQQAAALPLAGLTAYRALFSRCELKAGENVLISGVGGGVALFAFQFAVAAGANVWVTSGSEEKIEKAISLGAKGGVNYKNEDWFKELMRRSGGVDVIIDSAAGDGFKQFIKVANPGGRIAFYGGTKGKINGLNPQLIFWKQLNIFGSTMGSPEEFKKMVSFVNEYKVIPVVDSTFELSNGNAALERMDAGKQFGKIVLNIS